MPSVNVDYNVRMIGRTIDGEDVELGFFQFDSQKYVLYATQDSVGNRFIDTVFTYQQEVDLTWLASLTGAFSYITRKKKVISLKEFPSYFAQTKEFRVKGTSLTGQWITKATFKNGGPKKYFVLSCRTDKAFALYDPSRLHDESYIVLNINQVSSKVTRKYIRLLQQEMSYVRVQDWGTV